MSYPFGSGMPPLPNTNSSSPYPSYPSQTNPSMPQPSPYPRQAMQYPTPYGAAQAQGPYPYGGGGGGAMQPASVPFGAGAWATPQAPPAPAPHAAAGYPMPSSTTVYPPQSNATYHNPQYTTNSQNFPPHQQSGYSGYGFGQVGPSTGPPSYPIVNNMAPCFSQMQGHIKDVRRSKGNPTVVPAQNFDPVADANALRKAMKGFGTDEDGLINIICRRSNEQRQIIQRTYKTHFGKDLIEDIRSETSGNFENLLVSLLTPIIDFYVKELHDAMAGIGTDEDVLIEVLCTMSNYEIHTIKHAYERLYGKSLENELMSETSGNFKRLLVSLCAGARDESGIVDHDAATRDATELLRAGELRVGTDESTFNMVFCQRNFAQIKVICEKYQQMTGHGLEKAIRNEFSGDIMDGLIAILECTTNKAEFFAKRLHKSMAGIGTNDSQLIRVIVTRCEIDLNDIKAAFERLYGKSLRSWIKGDTSGHYKHALYALIGEQRSS